MKLVLIENYDDVVAVWALEASPLKPLSLYLSLLYVCLFVCPSKLFPPRNSTFPFSSGWTQFKFQIFSFSKPSDQLATFSRQINIFPTQVFHFSWSFDWIICAIHKEMRGKFMNDVGRILTGDFLVNVNENFVAAIVPLKKFENFKITFLMFLKRYWRIEFQWSII